MADGDGNGVGGLLDDLRPVRAVALGGGGNGEAGNQFAAVVAHGCGDAAQALLDFLVVEGHAVAPGAVLFAGFAVERVMTLLVITPGGVGLAETATAFALVALHADPVVSAAGVVIYRMFTYLFEIPVGAAWLAAWLIRQRA